MDKAFEFLMNGAAFIALQKNRYWERKGGLSLDAGPFVAALKYATGRRATAIGKPAEEFFGLALESNSHPASVVAMVGDDVELDIEGAQKCGMRAILVKTGKYRDDIIAQLPIRPDLTWSSTAELSAYLDTT